MRTSVARALTISAGSLALLLAGLFLGRVSAETTLERWTFVQDSSGNIWAVVTANSGELVRVGIPIFPATDAEIAAIPANGQWIVPGGESGVQTSREKPEWAVGGVGQASSLPAQAAAAPPAQPSSPAPPGIGTPVTLTGEQGARIILTVHSVTDPARSSNRFNDPDGRWVLVEWSARNEGTDNYRISEFDLKLLTADAFVIDHGSHAGHRGPEFDSATLGPGQTIRGFLAYDVPRDQGLKAAIFQNSRSRQLTIAVLG